MGRVEKLVVLVVLFAITAILVISMNTRSPSSGEGEASLVGLDERRERWSPEESAEEFAAPAEQELDELAGGTEPRPSAVDEPAADGETHAPVLLSSETRAPAEPPPAPPLEEADERTIPEDWDLLTLEGLAETLDPRTMLYTCRDRETFESLATRFYGDAAKAELLQRNNEGVRALEPGRTVFVPVRDDEPVAQATEYVVQEGDNLWGIAKKLYGKGSRWEEIYTANDTLLSTPDALRAGMVLRVP